MTADQAANHVSTAEPSDSACRLAASVRQAELISFFTHDDAEEDAGPYGPGATARATAAAQAALGCKLCAEYGREHDSHCTDI